jgi:ABC-type phosphate transport system permease subunit
LVLRWRFWRDAAPPAIDFAACRERDRFAPLLLALALALLLLPVSAAVTASGFRMVDRSMASSQTVPRTS